MKSNRLLNVLERAAFGASGLAAAALVVSATLLNLGNVRVLHVAMAAPAAASPVSYVPGQAFPAAVCDRARRDFQLAAPFVGLGAVRRAMARSLVLGGEPRRGAELLEQTIGRGDGAYALLAGNARAGLGEHNAAVHDWERAATSDAMRSELAKHIFSQASSGGHVGRGRVADAIEVLRDTIALPVASPTMRHVLQRQTADLYDAVDDETRAIAVVDEVLKEAPDDTVAADLRLLYLLRAHDDEAAETAAVQVLAHRPSWAAYLVRGTVRLNRCELKGAVSDCRAGLAQPAPADYRFEWLRMQLAFALWEAGDREGALAAWRRYAAAQPGSISDVIERAVQNRLPRRCTVARS